ncbi:predicted protein [Plenodomus lingam JN3]|uniref:Predicted protein n=1 Tax=Leptosphaeria maculans (strain JN3 / isolate v23.1.3 / race Av1-4-5-6-7-8) TaxID=985895 RepID=E4ZQ97_LEPMJ|nr:predicted protein [Plenodomus lingam JN3]CBX90007.1 predicted protein [Plenodomus lingam JN3]
MPDNASVVHETELNAKEEMITKLQRSETAGVEPVINKIIS